MSLCTAPPEALAGVWILISWALQGLYIPKVSRDANVAPRTMLYECEDDQALLDSPRSIHVWG